MGRNLKAPHRFRLVKEVMFMKKEVMFMKAIFKALMTITLGVVKHK